MRESDIAINVEYKKRRKKLKTSLIIRLIFYRFAYPVKRLNFQIQIQGIRLYHSGYYISFQFNYLHFCVAYDRNRTPVT